MTLMFCGLTGKSMTLRTYGNARTINRNDEDWEEHLSLFPKLPGARQIFDLDIDLVTTSCGSSFPFLTADHSRVENEFVCYWEEKSDEEMEAYWLKKNTLSLDRKPTGM